MDIVPSALQSKIALLSHSSREKQKIVYILKGEETRERAITADSIFAAG